jgi:hypothetical protein
VQDVENHTNSKYFVELGDGEFDEIIIHNKVCDVLSIKKETFPEET